MPQIVEYYFQDIEFSFNNHDIIIIWIYSKYRYIDFENKDVDVFNPNVHGCSFKHQLEM